MTIEEKVVRILENYRDDIVSTNERGTVNDQAVILTQSTQAILALIKPMSRERLFQIFTRVKGCKESLEDCSFKKCKSWTGCELLADAILAELEKGGNDKK